MQLGSVTRAPRSAVRPRMHLPPIPGAKAHTVQGVPGKQLPAVPPKHPALPRPVPGLAELLRIADAAANRNPWIPGSPPATIHNAHYANTRAQLAFALQGPYNSVEGDIRIRDGVAVMEHNKGAPYDLTFDQWATLASRAGRHMRIDIKEAAALPAIVATLDRLGVPSGSVTFNLSVGQPLSPANQPMEVVQELRRHFPVAWVTLNMALPFSLGCAYAVHWAHRLGGHHLAVSVMPGLVSAADVASLRTAFECVNSWNEPRLGAIDVAAQTAKLRSWGVNGMIDLRAQDDPLAQS
jgi:hypothetical protein